MGAIRIGTCSWTDPTLLRSGWYPAQARTAETRLHYYASQFDIVEVDSTYYAMLPQNTAKLWVERTPPGFIFNVKAFSLFTQHPTQLRSLTKDIKELLPEQTIARNNIYWRDMPDELRLRLWRRFEDSLLHLDSAGKLGAVLFQFPPWFYPSDESRQHVLHCQAMLPQYRIAVEFRHNSWLNDKNRERTLGFLKENSISYVCVDEPQGFKSSVPPIAEPTSDISVVRFHGRNAETWEKKGISVAERFNYLYRQDELSEWIPRIEYLTERSRQLHVLFNNCYGDYGVRNAKDIKDMLLRPRLFVLPDVGEEPD